LLVVGRKLKESGFNSSLLECGKNGDRVSVLH
jgi:hypothetical protein